MKKFWLVVDETDSERPRCVRMDTIRAARAHAEARVCQGYGPAVVLEAIEVTMMIPPAVPSTYTEPMGE